MIATLAYEIGLALLYMMSVHQQYEVGRCWLVKLIFNKKKKKTSEVNLLGINKVEKGKKKKKNKIKIYLEIYLFKGEC